MSYWRDRAACLGADPEAFFTEDTGNAARMRVAEAIAVCDTCPVIGDCRAWAKAHQESGVWGGRLMKRGVPQIVKLPPLHGTVSGYNRHRRRGEKACDSCREAERARNRSRKRAS